MASFHAELHVGDHTYPALYCSYQFTQATNSLGQVVAKVQAGLLYLTTVVPTDDVLVDWAATAFKALPGKVVFYNAKGGPALETLSWEVGYCVEYREEFTSGERTVGSYVCHVRISAPQLMLQAGGVGSYTPPAAGEHTSPKQALVSAPALPVDILPATWAGQATVGATGEALVANTLPHKTTRWAEYQRDHTGDPKMWSQARWDKQYDTNMQNTFQGLKREREYASAMNGASETVRTPFTLRQIDIFKADSSYCGQLKTGKLYLTDQVKLDLQKDDYLIKKEFLVEYILEKGGSKPLLDALKAIGAVVKIGPQIP